MKYNWGGFLTVSAAVNNLFGTNFTSDQADVAEEYARKQGYKIIVLFGLEKMKENIGERNETLKRLAKR